MENNVTFDQMHKDRIDLVLASGLRFCELEMVDRMHVLWAYREAWTEYMDGNYSHSTLRNQLFDLIVGLPLAGTTITLQEARSHD